MSCFDVIDATPSWLCKGVYTCQCCKTPYPNPKEGADPLVFLVPGSPLELKVITKERSSQSCRLDTKLFCIHCIVAEKLEMMTREHLSQAATGTPVKNYVTQVIARAAFFDQLFLKNSFLKKECKTPLQNRVVACFNNLSPENKRVVKVAIAITDVLDIVSVLGSLLSGIGTAIVAFRKLSGRVGVKKSSIVLRIITLTGVVGLGLSTSFTLLVLRELASGKLYPHLVEKTVSYIETKPQK